MTENVNVNNLVLPKHLVETAKARAVLDGSCVTSIIIASLVTRETLLKQQEAGNKLLIEQPDGDMRRIILNTTED